MHFPASYPHASLARTQVFALQCSAICLASVRVEEIWQRLSSSNGKFVFAPYWATGQPPCAMYVSISTISVKTLRECLIDGVPLPQPIRRLHGVGWAAGAGAGGKQDEARNREWLQAQVAVLGEEAGDLGLAGAAHAGERHVGPEIARVGVKPGGARRSLVGAVEAVESRTGRHARP